MGSIIITQVIYQGDKYEYVSRILGKGIQIIEGENGSGKTTFSSLICFGLGMYVKHFDKKNTDYHEEICSDSNNYVVLKVQIDGVDYEFKRYFSEKNNNIIFVTKDNTDSYFINRNSLVNKEDLTFSDWLLKKLGITVFDIFQGTKKFKINFSDLFRLMHYDQYTMPLKIYKEHRSDNNFVSDSAAIRRVIFEILMGYSFSEYYEKLGVLKKIEYERNGLKNAVDTFKLIHHINDETIEKEFSDIELELRKLNVQLEKVYLERSRINSVKVDISESDMKLQSYRLELFSVENELLNVLREKESLLIELNNLKSVKESLILEVTYIRKIIHTNQKLGIFAANKCPCCFKEVDLSGNICMCGSELEGDFNNFFYSSDEYLDILKSKQKAVDTIDIAIDSVLNDISENKQNYIYLSQRKTRLLEIIDAMRFEIELLTRVVEIDELNDKILEIKSRIQEKEQYRTVLNNLNKITRDFDRVNGLYNKTKIQLDRLSSSLTVSMQSLVINFEEVYMHLIQTIDKNVQSFELDDTFMPVINRGVYTQASSNVIRRIIYFLTLLYLSLTNPSVAYPKFILMDTPENLGIDENNLIGSLQAIDTILEVNKDLNVDFQIILTTGINKYPEKYKEYVFQTLTEEYKLLKEKL